MVCVHIIGNSGGAVFKWTKECDNAFKLLKEKTYGRAHVHQPLGK